MLVERTRDRDHSTATGESAATALRWSTRANLEWPVRVVADGVRIEATTLNIGPYGAFVPCPHPLALDQPVELSLQIPGSTRAIRAGARVTWSKKYGRDNPLSPPGMGLRFCDIHPDDHAMICEAVLGYMRTADAAPIETALPG